MLPVTVDNLRVFVDVLGATIWVGGQLIFSTLVPLMRRLGDDVLRPVARQLTRILRAGFAVLIVTGIWNVVAVGLSDQSSAWKTTLNVKLAVVTLSGIAAYVHTRVSGVRSRAVWGETSGVTALAALLLGVVLAG